MLFSQARRGASQKGGDHTKERNASLCDVMASRREELPLAKRNQAESERDLAGNGPRSLSRAGLGGRAEGAREI
jgi:hypothetical protein